MNKQGIAIIGSGNWGTTLACMLAQAGRTVTFLVRSDDEANLLRSAGENTRYLPGVPFPPSLAITADLSATLKQCGIVLLAVPSHTMRQNAARIYPHLADDTVILSCAKGLEQGTLRRMSEILSNELQEAPGRIGTLSGPNIAHEIASGKPAVSVVATYDDTAAMAAQALLTTSSFRVYASDDVIGVELAGALKNIIALGAGISDGMQTGDNAKAAFMTRGLAEIARLGTALGAQPLTFAGLAGLGDLVATCASPYSRNRRLGQALAEGRSLAEAQAELGQIAEGVPTVMAARTLANRHNIDMPITDQLYAVLFEGKRPQDALVDLMQREVKHELYGLSQRQEPNA